MSIESKADLEAMKRVGRIVALILVELRTKVVPGVTTAAIDQECAALLARYGARSGPQRAYGFPGSLCVSVNDEAVHGAPRARSIQPGDVVKLDLVAERGGYFADAAVTVTVPPVSATARQLARCARRAFQRARDVLRPGVRIMDVGGAIEREVRRCGFAVMPGLGGHGVGRAVHEPPSIPNFRDPRDHTVLTDRLVIAVEPIICAGSGSMVEDDDGWTIRTADQTLAAHYEHTMVITPHGPLILTALDSL
jgi:methionyl aminopeptidase